MAPCPAPDEQGPPSLPTSQFWSPLRSWGTLGRLLTLNSKQTSLDGGEDNGESISPKTPSRRRQSLKSYWVEVFMERMAVLRHRAKQVRQVVSRHPSTLTLPLFMAVLLAALGSYAVWAAGEVAAESRRSQASTQAESTASSLTLLFSTAVSSLYVLEGMIQERPDWPHWRDTFHKTAEAMQEKGYYNADVVLLQLQPAGVVMVGYPPQLNEKVLGLDNLDVSTPDFWSAQHTIVSKSLTVQIIEGLAQNGAPGAISRNPVFINNATEADTFGIDFPHRSCKSSGISACYNASTQTKWWGFATAVIDLDALLRNATWNNQLLQPLMDLGLDYKVEVLLKRSKGRSGSNSTASLGQSTGASSNSSSAFEATEERVVLYASIPKGHRLHAPERAVVKLPDGQTCELLVGPTTGSWQPRWRAGLWVLVAALSLLLPWMAFAMMVSRLEMQGLVSDLLPPVATKRLRQGKQYAESYLGVTLLFTDIVSYTTLSGSMSPRQLVELLNSIFHEADELCRRHGLYKVETIGDCLFCVAGCPEHCPAEDGAVRAAHMALDWLTFVEKFQDAEGRRIKVRVGLHTGNITAAVVGKTVHFSLFGDSVNVASRMESHGAPGRVHIAESTASLLQDHPEFRLIPRGTIDVKGKGPMSTFWLEREGTISLRVDQSPESASADPRPSFVPTPYLNNIVLPELSSRRRHKIVELPELKLKPELTGEGERSGERSGDRASGGQAVGRPVQLQLAVVQAQDQALARGEPLSLSGRLGRSTGRLTVERTSLSHASSVRSVGAEETSPV